ncbi:MAG: arylsulfotransferase family protein [Candidatus Hydrogenedentota bacterium]
MKSISRAAIGLAAIVGAFALGYLLDRSEQVPRSWRDALDRMTDGTPLEKGEAPIHAAIEHGEAAPLSDHPGPRELPDREAEALLALGYVQGELPASARSGLIQYDQDRAFPGLNLYVTGSAPMAVLIDMDGRELHRWECDFEKAFPGAVLPAYVRDAVRYSFRRVYLYPSGELLAVFENVGLIKLDWDSNLLWTYSGGAHHDLEVTPSGEILVLTQELRRFPEIDEHKNVVDNSIVVLSSDGVELRRVSILDCIANSDYRALLGHTPRRIDVLHTNTIERLDRALAGNGPAFREGNLLVSIRATDTVGIIDFDAKSLVWAVTGMWNAQHQPTFLSNGNLLVFDNYAGSDRSRVVEMDPRTQAVIWSYPGPNERPIFSNGSGSCDRLPNGNTLISISREGRAIEVTPEHEIVWEFVNPHQFVENGATMVGTLFEVIRLASDTCAELLAGVSQ